MSEVILRKKFLPRHLLMINLGIAFLTLLSVIPVNLTMRRYGFEYDLVPFTTSMICCMLPLLLSFPFLSYSRQIMNRFSSRYRFFAKNLLKHIFFILLILITLSLVLYFYLHNPSIPLDIRYPFLLSIVAIPSSYLTTISVLVVIDMIGHSSESVNENTINIRNVFSWITFALIILLALSQFFIFVGMIVVGICFAVYLCLFIITMIIFVKNEKRKKILSSEEISKPFSVSFLIIIYVLVTLVYFALLILYMVFLVKGYLIINFDEYYSGFFLAIQGSYVLFLIIFYSVIYGFIVKKKTFNL